MQTKVNVGPKKLAALCRLALAITVFSAAMFSLGSQDPRKFATSQPADKRSGMLDCSAPTGGKIDVSNFGTLTHIQVSFRRSGEGPKRDHSRVAGKNLAFNSSERWLAAIGRRSDCWIGPLPVTAGEKYSAQYMEEIFEPGMTAPAHVHSGPEAWYTLAGETCLETPKGRQIGRAGSDHVIVPGGPPMHLTATGTVQRRALVLILHDSSKPATTPVHDWIPKGLCKN